MQAEIPQDFISAVPKADLHLHLDGSLRLETLIDLARERHIKLPSYEVEGLKKAVYKAHYENLGEYLEGFKYTCAVLCDEESLERCACELMEDSLAEGVRYIEVRFAPQLHLHGDLSMVRVTAAVVRGLETAATQHNRSPDVAAGRDVPCHFGIICCALRKFLPSHGPYYEGLLRALPQTPANESYAIASLELARAAVAMRDKHGLPVVGFDLAGEEAGYPASYHSRAYTYAHRHFLKKTVHAGEAYGPESIFQAITRCHANRIGHGTFLFASQMVRDEQDEAVGVYVERLAEYIASQRITLEVCLTSNLQTTPTITSVGHHPIREMLKRNIAVAICTDNRLVSHTTVSHELGLVADELEVSVHQFRNLVLAGFKGAFFAGTYNEKRTYFRKILDRYLALEREFGLRE